MKQQRSRDHPDNMDPIAILLLGYALRHNRETRDVQTHIYAEYTNEYSLTLPDSSFLPLSCEPLGDDAVFLRTPSS